MPPTPGSSVQVLRKDLGSSAGVHSRPHTHAVGCVDSPAGLSAPCQGLGCTPASFHLAPDQPWSAWARGGRWSVRLRKSLHLFPFYTFPSVQLSRLKFKSGSGKGGSHLRHRGGGRLFLSLCLKASFSLPQLPHAEYLLHARLWVKGQGVYGVTKSLTRQSDFHCSLFKSKVNALNHQNSSACNPTLKRMSYR